MKGKAEFIKQSAEYYVVVLYSISLFKKEQIGSMPCSISTICELKELGVSKAVKIEHFDIQKKYRKNGYAKLMIEELCDGLKHQVEDAPKVIIAFPAGETPLPDLYHIYMHLGFRFFTKTLIPTVYNVPMFRFV